MTHPRIYSANVSRPRSLLAAGNDGGMVEREGGEARNTGTREYMG